MADTADYRLLGPPEARHAAVITAAAPTDEAFSDPKDRSVKKESGALGPAGKTRTKKRSPTFPSSGDPCLDFFFFRVLPATPAATVSRLLAAAWAADPSTALHLVANLRGVRGSGKSDLESFYAAALWLHARHPATLAGDAASVAAYGYLKDLPGLLHRIVARRLFPRGSSPELDDDLPDEHYAYRARERLRRTALVQLRRALQLPEVFMSARAWESAVYTRVASVAMKNYQAVFLKHDAERFNAYLADVKSGKKRIAAGALLPHQIIESLGEDGDGAGAGVADLQWRRMVDDMRALCKLTNCVAVCDVSGSMSGLPMDVCVVLGLLASELTDDPWCGRVITFSERPAIHLITGDTLSKKVGFMRAMEWGMSTNFQAVFDKILEVAVDAGLPPGRMVQRVLVFSDMEFNEASAHPWETDYEAIVRKFSEAGYGPAVPEIVFWNLAYSKAVPVMSGQKGAALVSGFSKNLLKLFLDGGDIVTPRTIMEKAIVGPEYNKLAVFD